MNSWWYAILEAAKERSLRNQASETDVLCTCLVGENIGQLKVGFILPQICYSEKNSRILSCCGFSLTWSFCLALFCRWTGTSTERPFMVRRGGTVSVIESYKIDFNRKNTAGVPESLERSSNKKLAPFMAHKTSRGRARRKYDMHDEHGKQGGAAGWSVEYVCLVCHWINVTDCCQPNSFLAVSQKFSLKMPQQKSSSQALSCSTLYEINVCESGWSQ